MTDRQLEQLCEDVYCSVFHKKKVRLTAEFYPSKSMRHTIHFQRGTIQIKISQAMQNAPEIILETLCTILFLKLFKLKVDRRLYKAYREYLETNAHLLPQTQHRPPNPRYTPQGAYFNLNEFFDRINRTYFNDQLPRPVLGWSLRKAYRRLGFYNKEKNLLVISRIFDSAKTPPEVIEYLMYHEMLHIAIPTVHNNGRRTVHGRSFRERERQFPKYEFVQKWLSKNLTKL